MRRCPPVIPRTAGGELELLPRPCTDRLRHAATLCAWRAASCRGVFLHPGWATRSAPERGLSEVWHCSWPCHLGSCRRQIVLRGSTTDTSLCGAPRALVQPAQRTKHRSTPSCAREDQAGRRAAQSSVRGRPKPSDGRVEHTEVASVLVVLCEQRLRGLSGGREVAERGAADSLSSLHEVQPPVRFTPRVRKRSTGPAVAKTQLQTNSIVSCVHKTF